MNPHDESPFEDLAETVEATRAATKSPALASRLSRLGAAIIDALIGCAIGFPIMFATGFFQRAMQQKTSLVETLLMTVIGIAIYLVVHGYLLASRGQTIGKVVAGARIVDYNSGEILPLARLIGLRLIPVTIISSIPLVGGLLALIDTLFIFGSEQRCVHDLIAGTKVVQA